MIEVLEACEFKLDLARSSRIQVNKNLLSTAVIGVINFLSQLLLHYKVALRLRWDYYRLRRRYRNSQGLKIQFGCGDNLLPGWLNTDLMPRQKGVYAVDTKKKMPFQDNSTRFIYCEHLIEHLTKKESITFLKECYRILQPGGIIRMAWPELTHIVNAYLHSDPKTRDTGNPESETLGDKLNDNFYLHGHKYIYDFHTLRLTMARIEYTGYQQVKRGESAHLELRNVEQRASSHAVIEAQKP